MPEPRFHIHTSNRLEELATHFAEVIVGSPLPPLEDEVVVVHSQGMARWLTLFLARKLGIAAGIDTPFPGHFCRRLADAVEVGDLEEEEEALDSREMLTWRLFALLGQGPAHPAVADAESPPENARATPSTYLAEDPDQRKRHQLAARLANLFDDYQLFRPDLLAAWERHEELLSEDGERNEDPHGERWQADLWRRLRKQSQDPPLARRLLQLLRVLERGELSAENLPSRLTVFGVSTLPPVFIRVLTALARYLTVRLYFTSPTYHYWGDLRSEREVERLKRRFRGRVTSGSLEHFEQGHPLLAALGRQGREFFHALQASDEAGTAWQELDFQEPEGDTLLARLQSDILHLIDRGADAQDPTAAPLPYDVEDRSLKLHSCHSPMREMEVLRDQLLDAFGHLEDLRPDDVLVLVPDIERYGPYIEAVFGAREQTTFMPYSVADRQAAQEQPPADTVLRLLALVRARLTPTEVLDLLDTAAVRHRFELPEKEVPTLRRRVEEAKIRWGMDGGQRREDFEVPAEEGNTWRAGLDRLLMGYATGPLPGLAAGVAPKAGATAGDADLLGRLATFVEVLFTELRRLRDPRPLGQWATDLGRTLDRLFLPREEAEERALQWVRDLLDRLAEVEERARVEEAVSLEVVRDHLMARLADVGPGGRFLSGRITFCALKPMRTIPFRVVAISGLDATSFPRRDIPRGFDLMRRSPRPGDRSLRDDDRQLFLETLLAARDRLLLTWVGRSQQDGSPCAPSVVVSELLDVLERGFLPPDAIPLRDQLVVEHRLQPFHPSYFGPGPLWSYSPHDLAAAQTLLRPRQEAPTFAESSHLRLVSAEEEFEEIELLDLLDFWVHPARYYCRKVLGVYLEKAGEEPETAEPFQVEGLDHYQLSQWLLHQRLHGDGLDDEELTILRARGDLPLAGLGKATFAMLRSRVEAFSARLPTFEQQPPQVLEIKGPGHVLRGRLDDLTNLGQLRFRLSGLKPKDQLRAWILHLAWNTLPGGETLPGERHTLLFAEDTHLRFPAQASSADVLGELVAGYRAGNESPLPFFEYSSLAYVAQRKRLADPRSRNARDPLEAARDPWLGRGRRWDLPALPAESEDLYTGLAFRGREPLEEPAFSHWAETVWRPLLDAVEEITP